MAHSFWQHIRRLRSENRGIVLIWVALFISVLMGGVSLAIDLGMAYYTRVRLGNALDAAGLAMGAAPAGTSQDELKRIGQLYFDQNFGKDPLTGKQVTMNAAFSADQTTITTSATAALGTNFARVLGFDIIAVANSSEVRRRTKGLELALVLDNTGSMWSNNNIEAVRQSTNTLLSTLFQYAGQDYLKVGLVPYSVAVNVSPIANQIVKPITRPLDTANFNTENWKGCVIERAPPHDVLDTSTTTGGYWTQYWWPTSVDNAWAPAVLNNKGQVVKPAEIDNDTKKLDNDVHSPNIGCPTPILPLTTDRQKVTAAVKAMTAWNRGGTMSNVGMAWGLRMLSPEPPLTEGAAWDDSEWQKAVVLMTDGENTLFTLRDDLTVNKRADAGTSDWSAYGRIDSAFAKSVFGTTDKNAVIAKMNDKLSSVCAEMKKKNITVYTVVFTSGISESTRKIYQQCASDPGKYFYAPSQEALKASFTTIANELSNLRISR